MSDLHERAKIQREINARAEIVRKIPAAKKYINLVQLIPSDGGFLINAYNVPDKVLAAQIEALGAV